MIKVAWKSPLIADTQNYKQMYTVLQVHALVKIIILWPIPVLCQNNLLLVNWIWQLLQLSKLSFLRKMMYTILLKSKLMVSSQNSTLNPQNHQRSRIEGWGWKTLWYSRLLASKFLFYNTICCHSWLPCKDDCYIFISIVTCIYMYIYILN